MTTTRDRARGALIGLAAGDAVGTTVEFRRPGSFPPVTDMVGGGPFGLEPGQFTDDTSMALCLAESLSELGRFDTRDQLARYVRWWRHGHLSSTGRCFDIGGATRTALSRFEAKGELVNTRRARGRQRLAHAPRAGRAVRARRRGARGRARGAQLADDTRRAAGDGRLPALRGDADARRGRREQGGAARSGPVGARRAASGGRGDRTRLLPAPQPARDHGQRLRRALPRGRAVGLRAERDVRGGMPAGREPRRRCRHHRRGLRPDRRGVLRRVGHSRRSGASSSRCGRRSMRSPTSWHAGRAPSAPIRRCCRSCTPTGSSPAS